mmetsp:Transcript_105041/g.226578  ORF Transcript_105041/g.226578 Transcript_105041/m.226578 type:complete len:193 (+) Transcript_105041:3-581(+)
MRTVRSHFGSSSSRERTVRIPRPTAPPVPNSPRDRMPAASAKGLSQEELLVKLCEPPFNQSKAVPKDAVIEHTPEARWWRSDSPREMGDDHEEDHTAGHVDSNMSMTAGVLGHGKRSGPTCYMTAMGAGPNKAAHFVEDPRAPVTIAGYGGHIAGKVAGNCIGGTYEKAYLDAQEHLKTTSQTMRYGATSHK